MRPIEIQQVLEKVSYPDYAWKFSIESGRFWLQATFTAACTRTGVVGEQFTRKWYLSNEATESEIVQTALKCVLTSIEHEARESFHYKGRPIFGPHYSVETLWQACEEEGNLDERAAK